MASSSGNDLGKHPVSVDDDSDVDDLDDVLEDFTRNPPAKPAPQNTKAAAAMGPSPPPPPAASSRPPDDQGVDFAEEFARQMEAMLRELNTDQQNPSRTTDDPTPDEQMRSAWEDLLIKSMDGVVPEMPDSGKAAAGGSEDAFQSRLQEAVERLHRNDTEQQAVPQADDDDLSAFLTSGDDDSLQNLLEGMMGQLMSKEVLYEPLKELNDKFPSYLTSNRDKLSASDLARYEAQHACASQIIAIVDLMSKMQEHGAPPAEIMGELPPGLDVGPDGAPKLPDDCVIG
ncbi:Pex19 protein family-domain-containing protein [Russula vinacea]|nr:Pex19 protein family-domain-containing protein [Russula vinacea]